MGALKGSDMIIHAGDLVDLSVLAQLKTICGNVKAVWGNMDPQEVRKKLPEKELIKIGSHKIGVMHGYGPAERLLDTVSAAFKGDGADIIIFGHSHQSLNKKKDGILFLNPGSLTDTILSKYNSYGVLEIDEKSQKVEAKIIKL